MDSLRSGLEVKQASKLRTYVCIYIYMYGDAFKGGYRGYIRGNIGFFRV